MKYDKIMSAILDYDFQNKEIVAIWAYRMKPYTGKEYGKSWLAYDHEPKGATADV